MQTASVNATPEGNVRTLNAMSNNEIPVSLNKNLAYLCTRRFFKKTLLQLFLFLEENYISVIFDQKNGNEVFYYVVKIL